MWEPNKKAILDVSSTDPLFDDEVVPGHFRQDLASEVSLEDAEQRKNWRSQLIKIASLVTKERREGEILRIEKDAIYQTLMYENSVKQSFDESFQLIQNFLVKSTSDENEENVLKTLGLKENDPRVIPISEKTSSNWNLDVKNGPLRNFRRAIAKDGILAVGKRPDPVETEKLRDQIYQAADIPLYLGNVRVLVEAMKHLPNACALIGTCAQNGVRNIAFTGWIIKFYQT